MSAPALPLSRQARRTEPSPIAYFIRTALETPGLVSLAAGLVDPETLPVAEVARAAAEVFADPALARAALQYGSTAGYAPLREAIVERFAADHGRTPGQLSLTADDVVLTTGSQQCLYLLGEALCDAGDVVITEAPSYFVYHGVLQSQGVRTRSVPVDAGGMCLRRLEELLTRMEADGELGRVRFLYTVSDSQNPTGLSLAAERRPKLVELAKRFSRDRRIVVLEDAAYRELRYDGPPLPAVKSFDPANEWVAFTTTFSKPCAPGLKTGYAILPTELAEMAGRLKANHDFGSAHLPQVLLHRLIESGDYDRHAASLRDSYRRKRDAMLAALDEHFGDRDGVSWTRPEGGLYVYATFPESVPTGPGGALMGAALAEGVLYVPGEFGHVPGEGGPGAKCAARLSFGVADAPTIREGVRRLRRAFDRAGG